MKLRGVENGLGKAKARKAEIEEQMAANRPSICLGSRKLFEKQFNLEENGFEDHVEWRQEWRSKRRSQFFVLGSKDENMGCQGCVMELQPDGKLTLRIRLPYALEEQYGRYLTIENIEIDYQHKMLRVANLLNIKGPSRRYAVESDKELFSELPALRGLAVNYRFVRDEKGWRVLISMEKPDLPEVTTDVALGAIGVDLNRDHLAVCEIDHDGNHVRSWSVPLPRGLRATSRQNRTAIELATKDLVRYAKEVGKPLVIEKLDFAAKKAALHKKRNPKYNAMLSSFSFRVFEQAITRQGLVMGVQVRQVNPAWTSFLGRLKYQNQTRGRGHEAAALVIARRGRGHRDRLPKESRQTFRCGEIRTFPVPVDTWKERYGSCAQVRRAFDKWFTAQIRELRLRLEEALSQRRSPRRDCQTRTVSLEEASLIPY